MKKKIPLLARFASFPIRRSNPAPSRIPHPYFLLQTT